MAIFKHGLREGYDYNECVATEGQRLRTQAQLLSAIDKPLFKSVIDKYPNAVVLDIGCNEGDSAMDRLNGLNIGTYIGCDISSVAIDKAKTKYEDSNTLFFQLDITASDTNRALYNILGQVGTVQADVIIISLVLLHLTNPDDALRNLYPFLKRGGTIIIKDIDDRDNYAYPDTQGFFTKSYAIADANRDSGNRNIGREIPMWLKDIGYKNIQCILKGINSRGMSDEQKQAFWNIYYGFFIEDSLAECRYTNGSSKSLSNLGWCHYYLPQMHTIFMLPTFEFTLGICVYTATKEE